jgi:hypothetical protein
MRASRENMADIEVIWWKNEGVKRKHGGHRSYMVEKRGSQGKYGGNLRKSRKYGGNTVKSREIWWKCQGKHGGNISDYKKYGGNVRK